MLLRFVNAFGFSAWTLLMAKRAEISIVSEQFNSELEYNWIVRNEWWIITVDQFIELIESSLHTPAVLWQAHERQLNEICMITGVLRDTIEEKEHFITFCMN